MAESEKYGKTGLDMKGAHGMILSHVKPGSVVLECGCASGYMTKYLKEELHCSVSVIEQDKDCIAKALEYADDGWCGDLETGPWTGHYYGKTFDFILFADVLEHLKDPLSVLRSAASMLKKGGRVLVSIPNICHNDVIIRMYYDQWNYTKMGLLDNTHVHFFGGGTLAWFMNEAGLKIETVEGVTIPTGHTEQRVPKIEEVDEDLMLALEKRKYGEIYQYILVCGRSDEV